MESNEWFYKNPFASWCLGGKKIVILGLLYFLTRLYRLTVFPIFSDESIYIHLAEKIADDPLNLLFVRMEGKNPLFYWLNALTLNVFANPLVAGRVVSVFAGFASMTGIYLIGKKLYSEKHGLVAALIYILCPYMLFFDRLALVDSLFCACGIWMVFATLRIVDTARSRENLQRYREFIVLGLVLGLALFTKGTAIFLLPMPLFILCLNGCRKYEGFWKKVLLSGIIACLPLILLYFFGKNVGYFERTDFFQIPNRLALTPTELLSFPWAIWWRNLTITVEFFLTYLTLPVALLAAFGFFLTFRKKEGATLILWALFPTLAIDAVASGFFSRYFLISVPPLILLATVATLRLLEFVKSGRISNHAATAILLTVVLFDGFFLPRTWSAIL